MDILPAVLPWWPLIAVCLGVLIVVPWARRQGATSLFAQDDSFEDVALSLISLIGDDGGRKLIDGRRELRPPFGYRAIVPAILLGFVLGYDFRGIMTVIGLTDPQSQTYAIWAFWALFIYTVFELNVRQRVIYDETLITCWGVDLRRQERDLRDLVDIRMHEKRPALALTFANEKTLYVPKVLTGRDQFVSDMQRIAEANRARDLSAGKRGLKAQLGF